MTQTEQGTKAGAATPETAEFLEKVATLYGYGINRIAEVQKKGLAIATRQNEDLLQAWKEIAKAVPGTPGLPMLDLVSSAFERYADTQKTAIDLVLTQSHAILGVAKKSAANTAEAVAVADEMAQKTVEQTVAAQKKALDDSAALTSAAFQHAKAQMGIAGHTSATEFASRPRGVEPLAASQKELLDFAASPLQTASRTTGSNQ